MTSTPDMASILEDLAAGRIDAAEAARRIDAISAAPEPPAPDPAPAADDLASDDVAPDGDSDAWAAATDRPQRATHVRDELRPPDPVEGVDPIDPPPAVEPPRPVNTSGVERISIRAVGRRVRIVGEAGVATLAADGPHVLRRNGHVLEVSSDGELGASLDGFSILRAPRSLDDFRSLGLGKELFLRVNPAIAVDVEVTAGSLNTERVPRLGKVRVTAGGAKMLDVTEVSDALIQAGQATIKGTITSGRSRIRAESGSLTIELADSSDVTIVGEAQLGKVSWSGAHSGAGDEVVMGSGRGRLDVEVVMGHAQIRAGSTAEAGVA